VELLEDASPDPESPFEGKLKDALKFMGKRSQNELFKSLMDAEEMANIHPVRSSVKHTFSTVEGTAFSPSYSDSQFVSITLGRSAIHAAACCEK
jgi:hypothetical protein